MSLPCILEGSLRLTEPQFVGTFLVQVLQNINKEQGGPEARLAMDSMLSRSMQLAIKCRASGEMQTDNLRSL